MNPIQYKGKARRRINWDYRSSGYYFITINTKYKIHHLGTIKEGVMLPSAIGKIAEEFWHKIPLYSPHVSLRAFARSSAWHYCNQCQRHNLTREQTLW